MAEAKQFSPNILLFAGTSMMTLTMAVIPFCSRLWMLAFVLAIMGFFMGTIDTVANVSMIRIFGKDVSPFLQALHFFYGLGAFVSPMIAQPFLLNEDCSPFLDKAVKANPNVTLPAGTLEEAQEMTKIDYAFWILALMMVPVVALTFSLVGRDVYQKFKGPTCPYKDADEEEGASAPVPETPPVAVPRNRVIIMTGLCALIMCLYDGLQAAYGGYVYSYAVKGPVGVPAGDAAFLNALFWGTFAFGRLISIALATRLAPALMLCGNVMGCTFGLVLMLCVPTSMTVLVTGTVILGAFMSSVFPTALSYTEQHIRVTPPITSFLVFGAALGEMSMPVLVGHQFDKSPYSFLVSCSILCMFSLVVFLAFWWAARAHSNESSNHCPSGEGSEGTVLMTQHVKYYSRMKSDLSEPEDLASAESKP
ncbi:MFSD4 [Cordylochernes scorpioides]|uniref:Major facilitator superfamily domain-containing protein 4A n=1 Tax=Cordylochernes scorpioides TaxID=51811 RepID=A0ABY6L8A3_9ARAC|nr:MFSD4 [Cordylochernes scorpioides]